MLEWCNKTNGFVRVGEQDLFDLTVLSILPEGEGKKAACVCERERVCVCVCVPVSDEGKKWVVIYGVSI